MDHFDAQRVAAVRDSTERHRKRWELLTGAKVVAQSLTASQLAIGNASGTGTVLSLQDIPASCDRVPNPFGPYVAIML